MRAKSCPNWREIFSTWAARLAGANPSFDALHRFRLAAKRFRYVLELFRPCYGPGLEHRIERLQTLQQRLGEISDCATTEQLLSKRPDLRGAEKARLIRHLKELAAKRVFHFEREWQAEFTGPKMERWWMDYLARYAGAPRR